MICGDGTLTGYVHGVFSIVLPFVAYKLVRPLERFGFIRSNWRRLSWRLRA